MDIGCTSLSGEVPPCVIFGDWAVSIHRGILWFAVSVWDVTQPSLRDVVIVIHTLWDPVVCSFWMRRDPTFSKGHCHCHSHTVGSCGLQFLNETWPNLLKGTLSLSFIHREILWFAVSVNEMWPNLLKGTLSLSFTHCGILWFAVSVNEMWPNLLKGTLSLSFTHCGILWFAVSVNETWPNLLYGTLSL